MNRTLRFTRTASMALLAALSMSAGCTMKSQERPPLTGPSEFGTSIVVAVSPDVLRLDGASQSVVTVTARDTAGNPVRNLSLLVELAVGGVKADFGSLSARNIVTGSDGRATLVYTAPAAPSGPSVDPNTTVEILVTPLGSDAANSVTRLASIRLVASGVVIPPDGLTPYFTASTLTPTDHQDVLFDACNDPLRPCAPSNNPIATYSWNFGDGDTGTGRSITHAFDDPGTFVVGLTVTDFVGRSATTSQTIDVAGGATPTASFLTSPSSPRVGENVNFNASASRPATGRTIRFYDWDFGDGTQRTTTGPITAHDYQTPGTFAVTLVVTDDVGRSAVANATVTVGTDSPTADFTFSQTPPTASHTIQFNSATSSAIPGRTITSYNWDFGDGQSSTLASPSHSYTLGAGTYNVTLTVTDSAGKTGRVTKTVTVL